MKQTKKRKKAKEKAWETHTDAETHKCIHRKAIKVKSETITYKQKHYEVKKMPWQR